MISVSKLLCGLDAESDGLRYDAADGSKKPQITEAAQQRPVVVWNATKRCNLCCEHCYAGADAEGAPNELSTAEGKALIDDLAEFGAPVLLFSGGEPMAREDLAELVSYAADSGVRPVLSTNGTLLTRDRARGLKRAGLKYAGASVDGLPERNDRIRGQEGAFDAAVRGIEACLNAGLKTGLRYTITEHNVDDLAGVVDPLVDVGVDRFCFYYLDYGGRGADISDADLSPEATRRAVADLCDLTREYHDAGEEIETLLVGNYADARYLVEYADREMWTDRARLIYRSLRRNGGDPTGERVADVDPVGNVHFTQFWQGYSPGNVRDRSFGAIWSDESNPLLAGLRSREKHLSGRCADCASRSICRGGSRLRALSAHGDPFAPDPKCYLTDAERSGEGALSRIGGADGTAPADD